MEGSSSSSRKPPKKMKFLPKIPPKKEPKVIDPKPDPSGTATESVIDNKLLNLVKQAEHGPGQRRPKIEKNAPPMQVAFGEINPSTANRSLGICRSVKKHQDATNGIKEYEDPWDYYSYYPTTLPIRLPHTGDPEELDEKEFGNSSSAYDESSINAAKELGLTEEGTEGMFFFQFPTSLPLSRKQDSSADKGKGVIGANKRGFKLEELLPGNIGKLLVYKSGAVKLKLGEVLFDVSPGVDSTFAQNVMAINTKEKQCCVLGELRKQAVVVPDLDNITESLSNM